MTKDRKIAHIIANGVYYLNPTTWSGVIIDYDNNKMDYDAIYELSNEDLETLYQAAKG